MQYASVKMDETLAPKSQEVPSSISG